jgi:hypothetical protein
MQYTGLNLPIRAASERNVNKSRSKMDTSGFLKYGDGILTPSL